MDSFSIIYVTYPNATEAKSAAQKLVSAKLAACVNLIPQITSLYEWEGGLQEETETLALIKTKASLVTEAINMIKQHHSYTTPCITHIALTGGNENYLKWMHHQLST